MKLPFLAVALAATSIAPLAQAQVTAPDSTPQKLAEGFGWAEGCVSAADGAIYFTDQPKHLILKWQEGKLTEFLKREGRANGLCFDSAGNLYAAAGGTKEIWKIDLKKPEATEGTEALPLCGPNDLWVTPDGSGVYFTDPDFAKKEKSGVYFVAGSGGDVVKLVDDMVLPNGIIGTADGKTLYISDIEGGKTWKFAIEAPGKIGSKTLFCEKGSDGMTLDDAGNVYLTNKDGITIFNSKGEKLQNIELPEKPFTSNVCFGQGADGNTLYATSAKGFFSLKMQTKGVGPQ